ncbi:hypothetical protein AYI69_g4134 [Smittium culicis]|uniref:SAP30-binding protein n=1 Tax=Smittium culicis TaxID=133412 RepID=A0A1R1YG87_9FUNG|nr:hypothetical protein AYI69_g4134 [Smittium culicis]
MADALQSIFQYSDSEDSNSDAELSIIVKNIESHHTNKKNILKEMKKSIPYKDSKENSVLKINSSSEASKTEYEIDSRVEATPKESCVSSSEDSEYTKIQNHLLLELRSFAPKLLTSESNGVMETNQDLTEKFRNWEKLKKEGINFNDQLLKNKNFRNPNIYAKFIENLDIVETGSNFDIRKYNPSSFPESVYSDNLKLPSTSLNQGTVHNDNKNSVPREKVEFVLPKK